MSDLSKTEVAKTLLSGMPLVWHKEKKMQQIALTSAKARRLFQYILSSRIRESKGFPKSFLDGLAEAYSAGHDPAEATDSKESERWTTTVWKIHSIRTEGFGGINSWNGPPFHFVFDCQSHLLEGANGSGKSSLVGALLWALSGERPREASGDNSDSPNKVYDINNRVVGNWPPLATYPPHASELQSECRVSVAVTFKDKEGNSAVVERVWENGSSRQSCSSNFRIPPILLETGMLMPSRFSALRFNEGKGKLTDALQQLSGLDEYVQIGMLVESLCHGSREYLTHNQREISTAEITFRSELDSARVALAPINVTVPNFIPDDTKDGAGKMAQLGKHLSDRAAEYTKTIAGDLSSDLDLKNLSVQSQIGSAISNIRQRLETGLSGLASWRLISEMGNALDAEKIQQLTEAISIAKARAHEAAGLLEMSAADDKFQLKAVAARWHHHKSQDPITNCPLCGAKIPPSILIEELEALRLSGDATARTFDDNINRILVDLEEAIPIAARRAQNASLSFSPQDSLVNELTEIFVTSKDTSKILSQVGNLVQAAINRAPVSEELPLPRFDSPHDSTHKPILHQVHQKITEIEKCISIALWYRHHEPLWNQWWLSLVGESESRATETNAPEGLRIHLDRISESLSHSEPFRKGAEHMRKAWKAGVAYSTLMVEMSMRREIANCLLPLKSLGSFSETTTKDAISRLSSRIKKQLDQTLLTEQFSYLDARHSKKEGVEIRGGFSNDFQIDATLVANTSWIRAVLWAFLFSLREEAVDQIGLDPFPMLLLDDPQHTFDAMHRHRWCMQLASLQHGTSQAQIILTTHDQPFIELAKISGLSGREGLLVPSSNKHGPLSILLGDQIERLWESVQSAKTDGVARDFIAKVRLHVEGLLRLILRGEDASATLVGHGTVLGASREKLSQLHDHNLQPWNRPEVKSLVNNLRKDSTAIKHIEMAHHASASSLGMAEAVDVEKHWSKNLKHSLEIVCRLVRDYRSLHGGGTVLKPAPLSIALPDGQKEIVRAIPLKILGRAAAITNGNAADGRVDFDEFELAKQERVVLAQHKIFQLASATLEPVARRGDFLLIKEVGTPPPKSLVVALVEDKLHARRFDIATSASDVAVLTAQAINPAQIAPPIVTAKGSIQLFPIVGILFNHGSLPNIESNGHEARECTGSASLRDIVQRIFGLVKIVGNSAEPYVLNGQHLIIGDRIGDVTTIQQHIGRLVVAGDSNDLRYFKRLQIPHGGRAILESLDVTGDHEPIVLAMNRGTETYLKEIWPVMGVLFELPS